MFLIHRSGTVDSRTVLPQFGHPRQRPRTLHFGGRRSYGYQLADAGPHLNPGKATAGLRLRRLDPDPSAAPGVKRIFAEYLSGRGSTPSPTRPPRTASPSPSAADFPSGSQNSLVPFDACQSAESAGRRAKVNSENGWEQPSLSSEPR